MAPRVAGRFFTKDGDEKDSAISSNELVGRTDDLDSSKHSGSQGLRHGAGHRLPELAHLLFCLGYGGLADIVGYLAPKRKVVDGRSTDR